MPQKSKQIASQSGDVPGFSWFWDCLDQYLEQHKLKQTQQRRQIVECFLKINAHVDAEELLSKLRQEGLEIGLATVYRTLNLLRDAGLVEEHSFNDGRSVFEVAQPHAHHDHLICLECGIVIEFENSEIEKIQKEIATKYAMTLKSHRLDLYGVCEDTNACRSRSKRKRF
jgi:Fur family transcriptional regulator, ferric uptake regulator